MAISDEQLARINFLARKSKGEGLTELEKTEQQELRMAYVSAVKASLTPLLESITVVEVDEITMEQRVVRRAVTVTDTIADGVETITVQETVEQEGG